jgi:hypothetical protein
LPGPRHWAGHGAPQFAVVADDGHLSAAHPEGDTLTGQFVADVQLFVGPAGRMRALAVSLEVREMFGWADEWLGDDVALAGRLAAPCLAGLELVVLLPLGEGHEFVEPGLCVPGRLGGVRRVG